MPEAAPISPQTPEEQNPTPIPPEPFPTPEPEPLPEPQPPPIIAPPPVTRSFVPPTSSSFTPPSVPNQPTPPPTAPRVASSSSGSSIWPILAGIGLLFLIGVGAVLFFLKPDLSFLGFGGSSAPVTLKYWGLWEPEAVMKPLIDEYQAAHPSVTITYEKRSPTQYRETLLARLQDGSGPDIFRIHNTWLPMFKNSSTAEVAEMPSSTYSSSDMASTFYDTVTADLSRGGKYYAVPLMFDGLALIYNEDLLKAAGLSAAPTTWTDVRQTYAPKLTKYDNAGKISVAGIAMGTSTNVDNYSDILGVLMLQNGVKMVDGAAIGFDKSKSADGRNLGADALDFYTLFAKKSFSGSGAAWDETLPSGIQAFATGKAAMVLASSFRLLDILNLMSKNGQTFNIKVAPLPQALPVSQAAPVYWASYWAEAVSSHSPAANQAAAWDFLKFLSSHDSLSKLYAEQAKTRPFGEIPSRVDMADMLKGDSFVGAYVASAKEAKSWYMASGTLDNGLNDQINAYFGTAVTSVLKQGTASTEALTTAAQGVEQVLSRYGIVSAGASK